MGGVCAKESTRAARHMRATLDQRLADARELERIAAEYTVKLPVRLDPAML